MAVSIYTVNAERSGAYWALYVPEIDRHTQARHLREIDAMARDLVAIITGDDPAGIRLEVRIATPPDAAHHLELAEQHRQEAHRAQRDAAGEQRAAAKALKSAGIPLRDIGILLGVSFQRAGQLTKAT